MIIIMMMGWRGWGSGAYFRKLKWDVKVKEKKLGKQSKFEFTLTFIFFALRRQTDIPFHTQKECGVMSDSKIELVNCQF